MADNLLYHFSDEDDDEDTLLDRAFDRWEQLGGAAAARGRLFQFHMQPIGRRRRCREVVERAQFNAQLRQLRDPVGGDNIGMALTEALHHAIETELDREQRPAHHFVNFAITAHGFTHAYQTATVFKWMWCFCPCQAQGPVVEKNTTLDVDAWTEKTRRNDASSPSKTEMPYAVLAPLSPCERTATKIKAWTNFANGIV